MFTPSRNPRAGLYIKQSAAPARSPNEQNFIVMTTLSPDLVQFLIRGGATALIVACVLLSVDRFGPAVGGYLTGVPIVIGPGIAFIAMDQDALVVSEVSRSALAALYGTQIFLVAFAWGALRELSPPAILALALALWLVAIGVMVPLHLPVTLLMGGFALLTFATRFWMRRFRAAHDLHRQLSVREALIRGLFGGLIVASAGLTGHLLPAEIGGIIVAVPIALIMITTSVQAKYGVGMLVSLAHAALLGVCGLAIFAFVVAQTIQHTPAVVSLTLALFACLAFTAAIAAFSPKS